MRGGNDTFNRFEDNTCISIPPQLGGSTPTPAQKTTLTLRGESTPGLKEKQVTCWRWKGQSSMSQQPVLLESALFYQLNLNRILIWMLYLSAAAKSSSAKFPTSQWPQTKKPKFTFSDLMTTEHLLLSARPFQGKISFLIKGNEKITPLEEEAPMKLFINLFKEMLFWVKICRVTWQLNRQFHPRLIVVWIF